MYAYIILHDMIIEYDGNAICHYSTNENLPTVEGVVFDLRVEYMVNRNRVYDRVGYRNLHVDLVEHVFNAKVNPVVYDFYDKHTYNYIKYNHLVQQTQDP